MKRLVKIDRAIPWMPKPGEGRLYITDEMPVKATWRTAFGFAFDGDKILLTRLRDRGWDIPGGGINPGETPEDAAIREVWEETCVKVDVIEMIGTQELEIFEFEPDRRRLPYAWGVQIYYLCGVIEIGPFKASTESLERGFFAPEEARLIPTMRNHDEIYEEALRRARS